MSIGEEDTPRGKTINVWSQCLRVPIEATDPIVEIVDDNEEDIGLRNALSLG